MRGAQTRRVIFLDIDGVLNSTAFFKAKMTPEQAAALRLLPPREPQNIEEHTRGMLDPVAIELLNELIEKSGAEVVISSSWRRFYSMGEIGRALSFNGFRHRRAIVGQTPPLSEKRGIEIQAWIDAQTDKPDAFVIIDDDGDMEHLCDRLVQTHYGAGLLAEHVRAAFAMLATPGPATGAESATRKGAQR